MERVDINIDSIELRMMRTLVKDKNNEYMMIPVWNFMGSKKDTLIGKRAIIEDTVGRKSFLIINAIDGSLVHSDLGY